MTIQDQEVSSVDKISEANAAIKSNNDGFADVFNGLENMSNTSTLFDGMDDDDDSPCKSKTSNTKSKFGESKKDGKESDLSREAEEVDPFDERNFNNTSDPIKNDDYLSQARSMKVTSNKIYEPSTIINKLKEEIRLKDAELQRMMLRMNSIHGPGSNTSLIGAGNEASHSSSSYHLAFMFASPLVRRINSSIEMIMQLDYQNEIMGIEKQLKDVKHEVRYKVEVATIENFRSVIVDAPFALHFTGHGIQNDQKALGSAYIQYKNKGDILLLEDENGMADYLFEDDLTRLVQLSKANREHTHNYEVVFVSS
jgi:hypothetical protein